ncbi:MAG: DNA mismatch repair protein MutS [Spirochaetota bacterium]
MIFKSILFGGMENGPDKEPSEPAFFPDLNLDQIIEAVTAGRDEYNLKPFFYAMPGDVETVNYRQEIMRDLENRTVFSCIKSFTEKMTVTRRYLGHAEKLYYKYHKEAWLLESAEIYCDAVVSFVHDLSGINLKSHGLSLFREYITDYTGSGRFKTLLKETKSFKSGLSKIKYCVLINGSNVKVRGYESETDYTPEIEKTFEKFKQHAVKDYLSKLSAVSGMNHVEARILEMAAKLNPEIFSGLLNYCEKNAAYTDRTVMVFDREIQFYIALLEYIAKFRRAGLNFCYPEVSDKNKNVYNYEGFDLALAEKCMAGKMPVICNDFYLKGKERIFIVSGPNQGGKTTFARTFGQLHYLAALGCPVPGKKAGLFLPGCVFTHFEKEEDIRTLRGKLQDDLVRIQSILEQAAPDSIILINEIFTSTSLKDAVFLSKKIIKKISGMDSLCVCVTFIDELASLSAKTVSMVSTVDPENPAVRTFKIIRKPADGLAYAVSIAEKYRLTYKLIKERMSA